MEYVEPFWDRIADRYAAKPVADPAAYERKLAVTREYLHAQADVLELGCGTGSTAIAHAPYVRRILATDASPRMIEIAREKACTAGVENVEFRCQSVHDIRVADGSYDAVLALNILHLLDDWRGTIANAHRILKRGGYLVSSTACLDDACKPLRLVAPLGRSLGLLPNLSFFTRRELAGAMTEAGFDIEHGWQPSRRQGLFIVARKAS